MTDRELLELAAKAAGIELCPGDAWRMITPRFSGLLLKDGATIWNPLTDDGDALRLAVKLGIDILQRTIWEEAIAVGALTEVCSQLWGDNPLAATRRAIVRAAAEIARKRATKEIAK